MIWLDIISSDIFLTKLVGPCFRTMYCGIAFLVLSFTDLQETVIKERASGLGSNFYLLRGQSKWLKLHSMTSIGYRYIYVSLRLRVQNAVPAEPCVGKLGISLVLLNFLHCNFRL